MIFHRVSPKTRLKLHSQIQKSGIINANPHLPKTVLHTTRFNVGLKKMRELGNLLTTF